VQYLSLHPLGPWAELIRHQEYDEADLDELRSVSWAARASVERVLELTLATCERDGIAPDDLVGDDYHATQVFARTQYAEFDALVFPSAALPGTRNLAIFGARVASPYALDPIGAIDVPLGKTAADATAPREVFQLVRRFGDDHAELAAVRAGRPFVFDDPLALS
jgi:hypothetical protein